MAVWASEIMIGKIIIQSQPSTHPYGIVVEKKEGGGKEVFSTNFLVCKTVRHPFLMFIVFNNEIVNQIDNIIYWKVGI